LDLLTVKFLTGFGQRPQHVLGAVGLGSFGLGTLTLLFETIRWSLYWIFNIGEIVELHKSPRSLYGVALLLLGVQLMSMGFLAELFIAYHSPQTKAYSISEKTGEENVKS
jgi:dolichol-phosphate mannosyltransferase